MKKAYHITLKSNLPRIRSEGLRARGGSGLHPSAKYSKRLYLFKNEADAMNFMEEAYGELGQRPVVLLELRLPANTRMYQDPDMPEGGFLAGWGYYIYKDIPPRDIMGVVSTYSTSDKEESLLTLDSLMGSLGISKEERQLGSEETLHRLVQRLKEEETSSKQDTGK